MKNKNLLKVAAIAAVFLSDLLHAQVMMMPTTVL